MKTGVDPENAMMHGGLQSGIRSLARAGVPLQLVIREIRRQYIAAAVEEFEGNQSKAAGHIGAHRNTVAREIGPRYGRRPVMSVKASRALAEEGFDHVACS